MIDWDTFKSQLQTNPGKLLKSVLLLAGCFLVIWLLVVLQSNTTNPNHVRIGESGQLDSLQVAARQSPVSDGSTGQRSVTAQNDAAGSDSYSVFPVALVFIITLAGAWLWIRTKKNGPTTGTPGSVFTTVGSQALPGGQQLVVIHLNSEYWVMSGGGPDGMKLLHRYPEEEWNGLPSQPAEQKNWKDTFRKTLQATASQKTNTN